jgi:hypothetical protein
MMRTGVRRGVSFVLGAVAGAGAVLSLLAAPTIGVFVLPATAGLAGLLWCFADRRLAGPGLLAGLGLVPLYIGYLNRGGPGTVCTSTVLAQSCTQEMSPWPWAAAGLCLAEAGVAVKIKLTRQTS